MTDPAPSPYEMEEFARLARWRAPSPPSRREKLRSLVERPLDRAVDLALESDVARLLVDTTVRRGLRSVEDFVLEGLRPELVFAAYTPPATGFEDVASRDLRAVDAVIAPIRDRFRHIAQIEGALTGVPGAWALPLDIVALLGISLRGVGELATACGYDMSDPEERRWALRTLCAPPPSQQGRPVPTAPGVTALSTRQTLSVARNMARKEARQMAVTGVAGISMRRLIKSFLTRVARSRARFAVPLWGAAVGASVNGRFLDGVLLEAGMHYRQRFLIRKYGLDRVLAAEPAPS